MKWTEYLGIFCVPMARFIHENNLKIFSLYSMRRCVHQLSHPIGYMINNSMFFTTSIFVTTILTHKVRVVMIICLKCIDLWGLGMCNHILFYRCSSAAERLNTSFVTFLLVPQGTGPFYEWLSPYKRKVVGSKPTAGIVKLDAINAAYLVSFHISFHISF